MKKILMTSLVIIIMFFISGKIYAQQTDYWYKITEEYDTKTDYRRAINDVYYFKVTQTSKGIVVNMYIRNANDYEKAKTSNDPYTFFKYAAYENSTYIYDGTKDCGMGVSFPYGKVMISSDRERLNYDDLYSNKILIGIRVNDPKDTFTKSGYNMF